MSVNIVWAENRMLSSNFWSGAISQSLFRREIHFFLVGIVDTFYYMQNLQPEMKYAVLSSHSRYQGTKCINFIYLWFNQRGKFRKIFSGKRFVAIYRFFRFWIWTLPRRNPLRWNESADMCRKKADREKSMTLNSVDCMLM